MMGWERNDENDSGMTFQMKASIQSTHHPLQRVVGGKTSRLEWEGWFRNDGMSQEWCEWFRDEIPNRSANSIHPPPSAEGGGWIDFTLRKRGMTHEWWNGGGMTGIRMEWRIFLMEKILNLSIPVHPCHLKSFWNDFFLIWWSFWHWMTSEWLKRCWNDYFLILEWLQMTWMRVEWLEFLKQGKCPRFFSFSFCPHSIHIVSFMGHLVIPMQKLILMSFHHNRLIPLPSHHSYVIPSLQAHSIVIPSL